MSTRFFMSLMIRIPGQLLQTVTQIGSGHIPREREREKLHCYDGIKSGLVSVVSEEQ